MRYGIESHFHLPLILLIGKWKTILSFSRIVVTYVIISNSIRILSNDTMTPYLPAILVNCIPQELVQHDYWWPGLYSFVRNYVAGCTVCQQHKINRHPSNPPLQPIKSLSLHPFSLITMDFITDLPISDGFDSILVMVDHGSSKGVILEPCHKTIDAIGTASIILNSLYC